MKLSLDLMGEDSLAQGIIGVLTLMTGARYNTSLYLAFPLLHVLC